MMDWDCILGFAIGAFAGVLWPRNLIRQPALKYIRCVLGFHRWRPESGLTCNPRDDGLVCTVCYVCYETKLDEARKT